jgi:3-oxoacyl-[acyl-carrier protein] reductase
LISAEWDNWEEWPNNLDQLKNSDLYTLRRITGRDRGQQWGDL